MMFIVIDEQSARPKFDFMPEQSQGQCSGQKGGVHENAFTEGKLVRDRTRLAKGESSRDKVCDRCVEKEELNVI